MEWRGARREAKAGPASGAIGGFAGGRNRFAAVYCGRPPHGDSRMPLQEWSESTLIAELSDEPIFSEDFESLMGRLEAAGSDVPDVIVNLLGVTRLNSSNLAQLLRLRKMLLAHDRRLRICSVDDTIWSVFVMTGLEKLFEFTDDIATSLASLQIESGQHARD